MNNHAFIWSPGIWVGEGKVTFSTSPDHLHFYTKWTIAEAVKGEIQATQEVEMRGGGDNVFNVFRFKKTDDSSFSVYLENELLGQTTGAGVTDAKTVAWDFREHPDFEGCEIYVLQENGDYSLHAEYVSPDQHRTTIDGRIWKKSS